MCAAREFSFLFVATNESEGVAQAAIIIGKLLSFVRPGGNARAYIRVPPSRSVCRRYIERDMKVRGMKNGIRTVSVSFCNARVDIGVANSQIYLPCRVKVRSRGRSIRYCGVMVIDLFS